MCEATTTFDRNEKIRFFIKRVSDYELRNEREEETIAMHGNGSDSGLNSPDHLTEEEECRPIENGEYLNGTDQWSTQSPESVSGLKVVIVIEKARKAFLGGYRNRLTGRIYHHALAQTDFPDKESFVTVSVTKTSRETQTVCVQHRSQQTPSTKACQTDRPGLHISSLEDKFVEPRVYITADQETTRKMHHIIAIQTLFRSYRARRIVSRMITEKDRNVTKTAEVAKFRDNDGGGDFQSNICPKRICNKQDLEDVYSHLERWKIHKLAEIKSSAILTGPSKKFAYLDIVRKETQILALVDKDRRLAANDQRHRTTQDLLKQLGQPKVWHGSRGDSIEVVTPLVSKCRKLRQFHHDLEASSGQETPIKRRMDVIEGLRAFLAQENRNSENKFGEEIISLIEREEELLSRGSSVSSVSALRQRITCHLLQHILESYIGENASASKNWSESRGTSGVNRCLSCGHYWPTRDFLSSAAAARLASKCRSCRELNNNVQAKYERGIYRHHLRWIRNEEQRLGLTSGIAFILQETDIHYMIDKIWHRRSALSEVDDPYDLILCRWHPDRAWSPWNCVLLTDNEAQVHRSMGIVEENYGTVFVQKVRHKQALGRRHFGRLPEVAIHFPKVAAPSLVTSMHIAVKPVILSSQFV